MFAERVRDHRPCAEAVLAGVRQVLLDAPCSGLGTIRRHPELKWRSRQEDIERLGPLQEGLLREAAGLCKIGGLIVYSVCTMSRRETDEVIDRVCGRAHLEPEDGPEWLNQWKTKTGQYKTRPHLDGLDGFFLMRLRKRS